MEGVKNSENGPKMPSSEQQEMINSYLYTLVNAATSPAEVFEALIKVSGFAELSGVAAVYTHPDAGRSDINGALHYARSMQEALDAGGDTTQYQDVGIPPYVIGKLRELSSVE